jgi:hypothetical protein
MAFSQVPDCIFMVRPASFGFNSDTASSNAFQHSATSDESVQETKKSVKQILKC